MEATAGFTDITEQARQELGLQPPNDEAASSGLVDITAQARQELGLDVFPTPRPAPDFKKLFATDDPFEAMEPERRAPLEDIYAQSYPDPDAKLNAKKRVASALYLAETMREDPAYVLQNLDGISSVYFNAKLSDAEAYRRIQVAVNPDSVNRQSFLDACGSQRRRTPARRRRRCFSLAFLAQSFRKAP